MYICTLYIYIQIYWDASKINISLVQVRIRGPGIEGVGGESVVPSHEKRAKLGLRIN